MDNNMNTAFSSTPHKPHYIPEFYHHFYPSKEQQILNSSSAASSPMSTMLYTSNLNQSEENDDNTDVETDQNDERQQQNDTNDDDKEPMFEKPLTPSDVGKLNRLVIPKQYAEKYFPLCGGGGGDSGGDKGLLLSFEDELGKFWRFRYSYWNSSQSYVLTKGWSRYVKEKRLDAGDIVLFERHRRDGERLFIGWRRRRSPEQDSGGGGAAQVNSGGNNTNRVFYSAPHPYPVHHNPHYQHHQYHHHHQHHQIPAVPYQPDCIHAGSSPAAHNQTTTFNGNNNNSNNSSKILRLFGVNLQCQSADHESEPSTPDGSSLLSQGPPPPLHHNFYPDHAYHSEYHHMDYASSRDVKPMRNRRG